MNEGADTSLVGLGVAESEGGWEGYFEAIFEKVSRARLDEDKKIYQGTVTRSP